MGAGARRHADPPALRRRGGRRARGGHVAIIVPAFDATLTALDAAGHPTQPRTPHWGAPRAYVHSPSGHLIELMAAPPPSSHLTSRGRVPRPGHLDRDMPRQRVHDRLISATAATNHGVVPRAALLAAGVPTHADRRPCAHRGSSSSLHRGVYALGHAQLRAQEVAGRGGRGLRSARGAEPRAAPRRCGVSWMRRCARSTCRSPSAQAHAGSAAASGRIALQDLVLATKLPCATRSV